MIRYQQCPACGHAAIDTILQVSDFSVTKEVFPIVQCRQCSLRFTQNVPAQHEIGLYYQFEDYISHTDTKKGVINRLYHLVRNITLKQKRKKITRHTGLKTGHLLDIGCGTGAFLNEMHQHGWQVTGLEPDAVTRKRAAELHNITLFDANEIYQLPAGQYDAITMWHVLEHVHDLQGYWQRLALLLKPGGVLFIAVPNYTSKDAATYKEHWAAWDVPRHLYHFSPQAMQTLAAKHGFHIQKHLPMWFDSYYVCMLSEKYKKGFLPKAVFNGLRSNMAAWSRQERCSSVIYVMKKK
jgi:2-polyprenyl-3-methyl-5-hydroxy-6-metoxy-1,4-benzoquinol methylase